LADVCLQGIRSDAYSAKIADEAWFDLAICTAAIGRGFIAIIALLAWCPHVIAAPLGANHGSGTRCRYLFADVAIFALAKFVATVPVGGSAIVAHLVIRLTSEAIAAGRLVSIQDREVADEQCRSAARIDRDVLPTDG
jgi:hypothetical protein